MNAMDSFYVDEDGKLIKGDILRYCKSDPRAITPVRNNPKDAGIDIFALEEVVIRPGEVVAVPTGIKVALNPSETVLLWDKSGRAYDMKNGKAVGLTVLAGCVDEPYRGEIIVVMANVNLAGTLGGIMQTLHNLIYYPNDDFRYTSNSEYLQNLFDKHDHDTVVIPYGKALTQMVIANLKYNTLREISPEAHAALPATDRGAKGFGSSDKSSA